ncbi:MAG TPA: UDP-N-acetylmuramate dehydrogenase [Burkholderiaceae bacterium]|nr:UDP-N-acetylmuramate dehydrogenase [Burkholderiaceae bacterium]
MPVNVESNVSLAALNTFGVEARAARFVRIQRAEQLSELLGDPELRSLPLLVLGGGSNVLFTRDFEGLVARIEIAGVERLGEKDGRHLVRVGAGENWHATVARLLDESLAGLENLALIPGSAGAAPIQNIGAYGLELAERFESLEAHDTTSCERVVLDAEQCRFGYRDSVFKQMPGRYVVLSVTLALPVEWTPVIGYADVEHELKSRVCARPQPRDVFEAVIGIRRRKLPDPAVIGNAGSFFKNPVVPRATRDRLREKFPSLVSYDIGGGRCKLAAGWLIDACGLKGYARGRAAVYERQALVLVNRGGATGAEILALAQEVQDRVRQKFDVALEPEPVIV